jgi:uncharacterized protein (UPF0261 family)
LTVAPPKPRVYAIATLDSKGREVDYLACQAREAGADAVVVDVSLYGPPQVPPDITRMEVASRHPRGAGKVMGPEGKNAAISAMSEALAAYLRDEHAAGRLAAAIGLGGSEGSALIAPALQGLPLGVPKVLVSTLASGQTRPYVGTTDMTLVFPVTDLAGLNFISRQVLRNAAYAVAAMARVGAPAGAKAPAVGLTMFGVTTACVDKVREKLDGRGWEGVAFHAVGTGGGALEHLAARGRFRALMDITTTEVADALLGGIYPAVPNRFRAVSDHDVPAVLSVGALDMVNFGPLESVPPRFLRRNLHAHTPQVTLMRTTPQENVLFARFIAERLNGGGGPWVMLLPEKGVSALDIAGGPFRDAEADEALFKALEGELKTGRGRSIRRVPFHINDAGFAEAAMAALDEVLAAGEAAAATESPGARRERPRSVPGASSR